MLTSATVFLDTSILLYASHGRIDTPAHFEIAQKLLLLDFGISAQILAEFFTQATTQGDSPLSQDAAENWVRLLSRKPCQDIDASLIQAAIANSHGLPLSIAIKLAAAARLKAATFYTQSLPHDSVYGSVTIHNPFHAIHT